MTEAISTANDFHRYADEFQFFGVSEFLNGSPDIYLADAQAMQRYRLLLKELTERDDRIEDVVALLRDPNPKVRVLAMMALFSRGADHSLGDIQQLVGDQEPAFPDPPPDAAAFCSGIGPPHEPIAVGDVAAVIVRAYMEASGASFNGEDPQCDFDKYWKARKSRTYCAGWFLVRFFRADLSSPLSEDSVTRLRKLRKKIDQVPQDERRWILITIAKEELDHLGTSYVVSEDELSRLCHEVGPNTVTKMYRSADPENGPRDPRLPDDPDLNLPILADFIAGHVRDMPYGKRY